MQQNGRNIVEIVQVSYFLLNYSLKTSCKAFNFDLYYTQGELRGWRNVFYVL